jgi:NAD(P)-dependent dehydrogenase (short-subunit alcohol dehydrogenase family)
MSTGACARPAPDKFPDKFPDELLSTRVRLQASDSSLQVNYLGPFYLTRLLESQLRTCNARVVNLSSLMHRMTRITNIKQFLTSPTQGAVTAQHRTQACFVSTVPRHRGLCGSLADRSAWMSVRKCCPGQREVAKDCSASAGEYGTTKLANAIFSQQLVERSRGQIRASSVDPGGVDTGIFRHHSLIAPIARLMGALGVFATAEQGCKAVVHACTAPWTCSTQPDAVLQAPFYARGLFASPLLSLGGRNGFAERALRAWCLPFCGLFDQLLRTVCRGGLGTSTTWEVPPNREVYNSEIGNALWAESSRLCSLSTEVS